MCGELYQSRLYDYHTILPFTLATLGFVEPLLIFFLLYARESLELVIRDCTSDKSHMSSHIMGVVVAVSLARAWGVNPRETAPKNLGVQALFVLASIIPTFLFFDWFYNKSLHHIFPFSIIGVLIVTRTVEASFGWYDMSLYLYVILAHFSVTPNSCMLSLGVILGAVVVGAYRHNLQNDSAVEPLDLGARLLGSRTK